MKRVLIAGVIVVVAALVFLILQASPRTYYLDYFKIQLLSAHANEDGALRVTLLLTNGTKVPLNVHDDSSGNPQIYIARDGKTWTRLTDIANMLRINLVPGTCLTNSIVLTNPPSRFRLACSLRDLGAERRVWFAYRVLPRKMASCFVEWRRPDWDLPLRYTEWIDLATMTNASPSPH